MPAATLFVDPARCINCRTCESACRECVGHPGVGVIRVDVIARGVSVASQPSMCLHCQEPAAPCAQVCPVDAIPIGPDGVVGQIADWCIGCMFCVDACPFGVLFVDPAWDLPVKCDLCPDRTGVGQQPLCAEVCPTQAIWYGTPERFRRERNGEPVDSIVLGGQVVRVRVPQVLPSGATRLDLDVAGEPGTPASPRTGQSHEEPWVL